MSSFSLFLTTSLLTDGAGGASLCPLIFSNYSRNAALASRSAAFPAAAGCYSFFVSGGIGTGVEVSSTAPPLIFSNCALNAALASASPAPPAASLAFSGCFSI